MSPTYKTFAAGLAATMGLMAGCASVPDVKIRYWPVKWAARATVTLSLACTEDKTQLVWAAAMTPRVQYSSDTTGDQPRVLRVKALDNALSDMELSVELTDDGRLKSINQTAAGQGEAAVKAIVALVTTLTATQLWARPTGPSTLVEQQQTAQAIEDTCKQIVAWAGGGKPLTLIYRADFGTDQPLGKGRPLEPAPESKRFHDQLQALSKGALPVFQVQAQTPSASAARPDYSPGAETAAVLVKLQDTATLVMEVKTLRGESVDQAAIIIPLQSSFDVPILKPQPFGKQGFSLQLAESGAVTKIGYTKGTGVAAAFNAAQSLAAPGTAAAKAAELTAEADLIAAQQRLVLCQAQPAQCK